MSIDNFDNALNRILTGNGTENDNKLIANAILKQIMEGWPYILKMKGVCYQIGLKLMETARNNHNERVIK